MPADANFGRYAEIPYDQMTPAQQEGYRFVKETRGQVGGGEQDLDTQSQIGEGGGTARCSFPSGPQLAQ